MTESAAPGARAHRRRVRGHRRAPGPGAEPGRAGHVLGDVERALLVQVQQGPPAHAADRGPAGPGRPGRRTPASSTSATGSRACSRWSRTRIPSAIEPYQGAATGVGGIVRDVLSMGARPAALLDPLRFGPLDDPRNRFLFGGVVAGIGGYGNCIGVPTVGGEVKFAECHTANPTVNVMCVGFVPADALVQSRAGEPGSVLLLIGAATGRDGIGGVSVLASATIEEDAHDVAAERADRRPVPREAADRSVPRAEGARPAGGAEGPGRRRADLRRVRGGGRRPAGRRPRPGPGAAPRGGHGDVRDPHVRVPGTDAGDRARRTTSRPRRRSAGSGAWRARPSPRSPTAGR